MREVSASHARTLNESKPVVLLEFSERVLLCLCRALSEHKPQAMCEVSASHARTLNESKPAALLEFSERVLLCSALLCSALLCSALLRDCHAFESVIQYLNSKTYFVAINSAKKNKMQSHYNSYKEILKVCSGFLSTCPLPISFGFLSFFLTAFSSDVFLVYLLTS